MKLLPMIFAASVPMLVACGNDDGSKPIPVVEVCPEPKFASLHSTVLAPKCGIVGCHAVKNPALGNLYLGSDVVMAYAATREATSKVTAPPDQAMRVVATSTATSFLYTRITAADPLDRMPPGGQLSECEIEAFRDWINAGAAND
jgi:hypothetical protein